MKAKIGMVSILSGVLLLMFSAGAFADGKKDRHHRKQYKRHIQKEVHHHYHGDATDRHHWKKYRKNDSIEHRRWAHDHKWRYRPRHGNYYRYRPWLRDHHHSHWAVKKHRHGKHHQPIYTHTDGNVSVMAAASDHGWSIRISSKDRKCVR